MKKQTTLALAAAVLLSGFTAASAAEMASSHSGAALRPSDTLNLTGAQQKTAWNDINQQAPLDQSLPASFDPTTGAVVPNGLKLSAVPSKAARDVPALRAYDFAMVQGKLLIVNPADKKVAEVIMG